jgi:phosphoserine phosphatase RsbU/P
LRELSEMKTLKSKFILIICLVYIVIGSLTVIAFRMGTGNIIEGLGTRFAVKQALLEKNKVLSLIDRDVALALKLADDPIVVRWLKNESDESLRKLAFESLESYRKLFHDKSFFIAVSRSGNYYVYNTKLGKTEVTRLKPDNSADKWYFEAVGKIDTFALNLDYNALINEIKVWINAVVRNDKGEKIGIGGSGLSIVDFVNEIVASKEKGVSTFLIDRAGVVQAHETRKYMEYNATVRDEGKKITVYSLMTNPDEQSRLKGIIESLTSGKTEVGTMFLTLDGRRYLAAVAFIKGIKWYNIVLADVSQVAKTADFLPIIATIVFSSLLIVLIIAVMLNKVVLKPLSALTEASVEMSQGRHDSSIPVSRNDEIGRLTEAFNSMTSTVLDHTNNLGHKVEERTAELVAANRKIEESQRQVMDSINYARMIQSSMLPERSLFQAHFREFFIIYSPRDIVGGDLYYLREVADNILVAVIDCTGHGVPGAFMAMTANAVLNHIVDAVCNDDPRRILSELNRLVRTTLHHDTSGFHIDSGLDIGLCIIDPAGRKLTFSGAGLSLFRFDGKETEEIKGDRQRIGYKDSSLDFLYTNHHLSWEEDVSLYITTDGFFDQAGGARGFGFGRGRFKAMIASAGTMPMAEQEQVFRGALDEYRGGMPQRDDIVFLGLKV